jgi:hypothetical protein
MDKVMIRDHLALAEEHVQLGLFHIAKQHAIIAELERDGLDATLAREVLATFEEMQGAHVADRDRLKAELEAAD